MLVKAAAYVFGDLGDDGVAELVTGALQAQVESAYPGKEADEPQRSHQ